MCPSPGFPPTGDHVTTFTPHTGSHPPNLYMFSPPPTLGANGPTFVSCDTKPNRTLCHGHAHLGIVHYFQAFLMDELNKLLTSILYYLNPMHGLVETWNMVQGFIQNITKAGQYDLKIK